MPRRDLHKGGNLFRFMIVKTVNFNHIGPQTHARDDIQVCYVRKIYSTAIKSWDNFYFCAITKIDCSFATEWKNADIMSEKWQERKFNFSTGRLRGNIYLQTCNTSVMNYI